MVERTAVGQDFIEMSSDFSDAASLSDSLVDANEFNSNSAPEVRANSKREAVSSAKSTDIRRKIEAQLEIQSLRDQLGMDDFDLN